MSSLSVLKQRFNKKNISQLNDESNYSIVHFYRPKFLTSSWVDYEIMMDDKTSIVPMKNGAVYDYKITQFKKYVFSAETEIDSKKSIAIDV